tara:strand:- start:2737 stop:3441 length:705 start_codon:yes stop_codon:yes gene_type:complete
MSRRLTRDIKALEDRIGVLEERVRGSLGDCCLGEEGGAGLAEVLAEKEEYFATEPEGIFPLPTEVPDVTGLDKRRVSRGPLVVADVGLPEARKPDSAPPVSEDPEVSEQLPTGIDAGELAYNLKKTGLSWAQVQGTTKDSEPWILAENYARREGLPIFPTRKDKKGVERRRKSKKRADRLKSTKPKATDKDLEEAYRLRLEGKGWSEISKAIGFGASHLLAARWAKRNGLKKAI